MLPDHQAGQRQLGVRRGCGSMVGGGAGWAKDCPEDANEAHQVIQEMHADTADPANVAFLHLVRRDKHH